jgi:membrane protease YdiL (CAAX protease family)
MSRHAAPTGPPSPPDPTVPPDPVLRRTPERRELALTLGLALFLNLLPGTFLQWLHIRWGLVVSQTFFIAGPALLGIRWFYLDRRALLPLHRPRALLLPAAAVGTLALNHLLTVAGAWHERILPPPEVYRLFFADLFIYRGPVDFALLLVVFAVVPAICEEILFRGFLLGGLVAILDSPAKGIVLQALIFVLFHLDPWRLPEIIALGLFLGFLAQRSGSLLPAILAHALNNTISIALAAAGRSESTFASGIREWSVPCAAALLAVSLIVVHRASAGRLRDRVL